jgi:uncharacterized protein YbjT (DUF2867 family)
MKEKILITSATGKTGFLAAKQLMNQGYPVKIFVRSKNKPAALELEKMGAEIVSGDLQNYDDLKRGLAGVNRVYYCYPFIPNLLENTKKFVRAAEENAVESVVFMGQWLAEFDDQKSIFTNETRAAYDLFDESKLKTVIINPGIFAANEMVILEFVVNLGLMPAPFGDGRNPAVSNEDLSAVIAALLKNPQPFYGQRLRPTGPESLSPKEKAAIFSKVIGRKVRYINIPNWMFLKAASLMKNDSGMEFEISDFLLSQYRHYLNEYKLNKFDVGGTTDVVKTLTGKEPNSYETIVKRYLDKSSFRDGSFSNWFATFLKFNKIPFAHIPGNKQMELLNS